MKRPLHVVALAVACLLALPGCSSGSTGHTATLAPTASATPTPTPTPSALAETAVPSFTPTPPKAKKKAPPKQIKATKRPKPPPKPRAEPPVASGVHPGAFCAPQGALGRTNAGTLMRCSTKAGDSRARWRSA